MARRPLPRILSNGSAQLVRSRELARTAADSATDVLHPLITITRGLRRLAAAGRRRWSETPKDKRGALLFLVASVILVVALMPYGPLLAAITLMAAAAWQGRERAASASDGPDESQAQRLQSLYEALVPYFSTAEDPEPLYSHGGTWEKAFPTYAFDGTGRISHLVIHYPAYFADGETEARARIEGLLAAKSGRGREYHFSWEEEGNQLTVSVLTPLAVDIAAQRFVTAPGETVLGFTDPSRVQRTLPLSYGEQQRDVPPVVWRTGLRSTEPHLLALGQPGTGTSTLLRSIALQALQHGDVVIIDGGGTGEYACLTGRDGVLAVECGLPGVLASLEWAAAETERRLIAANRAHQAGHPPPDDTKRPLWILLDRPTAFTHLAAAQDRKDPQSLLQVPLRHGRPANVTVVVAEQLDTMDALGEPVRRHTRARVVLGPATAAQLESVLGAPPHTTPVEEVPPGRGYARLGMGPVHRLQVPATPNPYDDATSDAHRQAVLDLLPPRTTPADGETVPEPEGTEAEPLTTDPKPGPVPEPVPVLTKPKDSIPNPVPVLTKPAKTKAKAT
ncbi:type IV secretory system conjugative DNA transfer family protein [Streptomyces violarus]|uniref:type IV secretory system conjugative DNA transfer family protein n=1 Tax=Streptomyces violarus TaxID=67380 RepID=UPI0021BFFE4F|nr:type IV secretory system conjugative DNA transfer family protein [Streptomyces violarus]MCT9138996.1 type IV secretory system conjugative DNA transfer family protein [Streptomyces violarus]